MLQGVQFFFLVGKVSFLLACLSFLWIPDLDAIYCCSTINGVVGYCLIECKTILWVFFTLRSIVEICSFVVRLMVVFQIPWSLQIVKLSNLGLQLQSTYPRWDFVLMFFSFSFSCYFIFNKVNWHQLLYFLVQWRSTLTICEEVQDHHTSRRGTCHPCTKCICSRSPT